VDYDEAFGARQTNRNFAHLTVITSVVNSCQHFTFKDQSSVHKIDLMFFNDLISFLFIPLKVHNTLRLSI